MKKYADDYEIVIVEDEKGNEKKTTVYRGAYYEIDVDQQRLDQLRGLSRFLLLGTALLHVGAGFVANPGMYQFYISLPYVLSFLPLYFLAEGMLRIPKEKRPFRSDEVGLSFGRMQKASPFLFFLLAAGVVGALIFIIGFAADPVCHPNPVPIITQTRKLDLSEELSRLAGGSFFVVISENIIM